jgi:3-deoxy-D-manno-octulosonate 8-phosphate phosphatase (KDO 8-P phosphatase)
MISVMEKSLEKKIKRIKLLAMDFDGVMTDGYVYVNERGEEMVRCSRKDGIGILLLKKYGINAIVISMEENPVVKFRCKKLKIDCWRNIKDGDSKLEILKRVADKEKISLKEVAYIGDDLNDLSVLKKVGLAITLSDGCLPAKKTSHYITKVRGGEHAVREVCELIISSQGKEIKL